MQHPKDKPIIGIAMGDPAGIGPEVALKSLAIPEIHDLCRPVLIGAHDLLDQLAQRLTPELRLVPGGDAPGQGASTPGDVEVCDMGALEGRIDLGVASEAAGEVALRSIRSAFGLATRGVVDGFVMAPISKESLVMTGAGYHSEFDLFADLAGVPEVKSVVKWGSIYRATVNRAHTFLGDRRALERAGDRADGLSSSRDHVPLWCGGAEGGCGSFEPPRWRRGPGRARGADHHHAGDSGAEGEGPARSRPGSG